MMNILKLPVTIRPATIDEIHQTKENLSIVNNRNDSKIVEGYTIQHPQLEDRYKFSAEINVDSDKLFQLLKELVINIQSETVALIYHHSDDEPKYGCYYDKYEIINFLEDYEYELVNDAFLEFGIIYSTKDFLEEVFVTKFKYLQYWGIKEELFMNTLLKYDLYKIDDLEFIDFYPVARTRLSIYKPDIVETSELIKIFNEKYGDQQLFPN